MGQELKKRPAKYEAGVYVSNALQSSVRKYVCFKCDFTNNNADGVNLLHTNLAGRRTMSSRQPNFILSYLRNTSMQDISLKE